MRKLILRVVGFMACFFIAALIIGSIVGPESKPAAASSSVAEPAPYIDPGQLAEASTTLSKYSWYKDHSGMIMFANFTIKNAGNVAVKDFKIRCRHSAASGTIIDSNTRTIYQIVPPHASRTFRNFEMGFIDSQAAASDCELKKVSLVR